MNYLQLVSRALGYRRFDLDYIFKLEATRFANYYYSRASMSEQPGAVREYAGWLAQIARYQRMVPQTTFFPTDMYEHIVGTLGLKSQPLPDQLFQSAFRRLRPFIRRHIEGIRQSVSQTDYSIHYCFTEKDPIEVPFRMIMPAAAALLYKVPEGFLLLHSWGTLKEYANTDSQLIENQILREKLRGLYLPVTFNH